MPLNLESTEATEQSRSFGVGTVASFFVSPVHDNKQRQTNMPGIV